MAKKNNVNTEVQVAEVVNPFVLEDAVVATAGSRTIPGAAELIAQCNSLAVEAIRKASADPAVGQLAAAMQNGGINELQAFVSATVEVPSTEVIENCTADELSRMLESRRSDRSKAKKAGLTTIDNIKRYVSAWVAELVIRQASGKAYKAPGTSTLGEFESDDVEAITRKIKSLQSKKCRLNAVLKYAANPEIEQEVADIEAEIARLNAMRGSKPRVKSTDTVKSMGLDDIRARVAAMPEEERAALMAMLAG